MYLPWIVIYVCTLLYWQVTAVCCCCVPLCAPAAALCAACSTAAALWLLAGLLAQLSGLFTLRLEFSVCAKYSVQHHRCTSPQSKKDHFLKQMKNNQWICSSNSVFYQLKILTTLLSFFSHSALNTTHFGLNLFSKLNILQIPLFCNAKHLKQILAVYKQPSHL